MSDVPPRSGFEFAEKILATHLEKGDVVETLLRYASNDECDFLELKASVHVPSEDCKPGELPSDIFWNIAHELIAMINSRGGILLLGVDNKGNHDVVPLKWAKDGTPVQDTELDKYIRSDIEDKIVPANRRWTYKGQQLSVADAFAHLLSPQKLRYQGHTVFAYLVKPREDDEILVQGKYKNGQPTPESMPYRVKGMIGKCHDYKTDKERRAYHATREICSTTLGIWYNKIESGLQAETDAAELDKLIHDYRTRLISEAQNSKVGLFVDLEAESDIPNESIKDICTFNDADSVPVSFIDELSDDDEEEDATDTSDDKSYTKNNTDSPSDDTNFVSIRRNLLDLLKDEPRLALIGEPGAGKTLSLQCFALRSMCQAEKPSQLHLFIPLGKWSDEHGGCIEGLAEYFSGMSWASLERLMSENRLHLILDALNECPDTLKAGASQAIAAFCRRHPSVPVIVAARTADDVRRFGFPTFAVRPMDHVQQLAFLSRYLDDNVRATDLLAQIHAQPGGTAIAANPMLLRMVSEVANESPDSKLPIGRGTLYRKWITRWYKREKSKALYAGTNLTYPSHHDAIRLLSKIALDGRIKGYRDIPLSVFKDAFPNIDLKDVILQGPIITIENDVLHFRHETFQEYLCAEALIDDPQALSSLSSFSYETWGMPLAYALELCEGIELPPALISYASSCSPWLGCIVNHTTVKDFPGETSIPFLVFRSLLASEQPDKDSAILLLSLLSQNRWYASIGESPLKYIVTTIPDIRSTWFKFERSTCIFLFTEARLNRRWDPVKETFFRSAILLRYRDVVDRINPSKIKPLLAARMIASGFADPSDLPAGTIAQLKESLKSPSVEMIAVCKAAGLCSEANLLPFQRANCAQFKQKELILLANAGIISREKLRKDLSRQLTSSSAGTLWQYIRAGLLTVNDLKQELDAINEKIAQNPLAQKSVIGFIHLTKLHAATHDLTPFYKSHWEALDPDRIRKLIRAGILSGEDIKKDIDKLSAKHKKSKRLLRLIDALDVTANPLITTPSSSKFTNCQLPTTLRTPENIFTALQIIQNSPIPTTVVVNKRTLEIELKIDHVNTPVQSSHHILKNAHEGETLQARLKIIPYFGYPGIFVYQAQSVTSVPLGIHEFMQNRKQPANAVCSADITTPSTLSSQIELQQQEAKSTQTLNQGIYSISALSHPETRKALRESLSKQTFVATCAKISKGNGLLTHPLFSDPIFLYASSVTERPILTGQKWSFFVRAKYNNKNAQGRFLACHATLLSDNCAHPSAGHSQTQPDIPTQSLAVDINRESFRNISSHALTIYIDETWPGTQDATYKSIGVIGGIAVAGDGWKKRILPVVKTHIRDYNYARKITREMLASPSVFPFALPIKLDRNAGASYFELVQHAILLLLGWLLPHDEHITVVDIYLEHITTFKDGHNETDFFNVLQQAMKLLGGSKRFSHWKIRQVKWVPKQFEYVPYADLVCQTCVPLHDQQKFAQDVHVRTWPGFLPFTPDLFPLLRDMDTASPSGFADLLISFSRTSRDTPLFKRILKQAVGRALNESTFRDAVLERFEYCYEQKDRDIALLNRLTEPFFDAFPLETFSDSPRMRLLRILLEMQRANHNGDPEAVNQLVADYKTQRQRLIEIDRELSAYADLNLIVHDHDLFLFEEGLSTANTWIADPLFPALSLVNRGRMLSSRGQSYALLKRHKDADREFNAAISLFESEAQLYRKEIDQTRVYQCFNLLDLEPSRAVDAMETILRNSLPEAGKYPASALGNPFHEHLFLKVLWTLRHDLKPTIQDYLAYSADWPAIQDCHPYELILFYRTLIIFDHDRNTAQDLARSSEALFERMSYGGTIGLIHSYIRIIFKHMQIGVASDAEFNDELNIVAGYLSAAKPQIDMLRRAWDDPSLDVSSVLPFNYK